MDIGEVELFINWQFGRLGMYAPTEEEMRLFFVQQLATRKRWWVLCRVVDYVERQLRYYYG
jgi:hypothetical protein